MQRSDLYVYGDQDVQVPAHLNFGKYILDRLRLRENEIAIEHGDTHLKLTYKEFTQYAVNMSAALRMLNIGRGDIVAFGSEKRNEFVPAVLAIMFTGATCTAYDLQSGQAVLIHKITITQPKYFICSNRFWETYSYILKSFDCLKKIITLDSKVESVESIIPITTLITSNVDINKFEPIQLQGQIDTAFILYSSGTTGMPKGVKLTHLNCILNSLPDCFKDESLQTAYIFGEWYHNYDTFMTFKFLVMGRKIVYFNDATPQTFLASVARFNINIAFIVPSYVHYLVKAKDIAQYNINSLKIIFSSSSPLHNMTVDKFKLRFPNQQILQRFWMTEGGEMTSECWGTYGPKSGSVGMVSPSVTLKVVNPETRETLGPNQRGEICIKGPMLMKGYIDIDLSVYLDDEGFYKTGDLGYYDDDKYFYIVEKLKDVLVYDGYKVAPLELETILQLHPGVREAGVVGKPVPDYGEEPTAFVVKETVAVQVDITEKDLIDYITSEVPPFMQLRGGVIFIEEMPKNSRGKILRQRLRDMLK